MGYVCNALEKLLRLLRFPFGPLEMNLRSNPNCQKHVMASGDETDEKGTAVKINNEVYGILAERFFISSRKSGQSLETMKCFICAK